MSNTRYAYPIDDAQTGAYDQLPNGLDNRWRESRWYDIASHVMTSGKSYRDYTLDQALADPETAPHIGAMVFHPFIEPFDENRAAAKGWHTAPVGSEPHIATISEPAGVEVYWSALTFPLFSQKGPGGHTPAWTIPYGSLYDYFAKRVTTTQTDNGPQKQIDLILLGGWDNTAFYGHERDIAEALAGGTGCIIVV